MESLGHIDRYFSQRKITVLLLSLIVIAGTGFRTYQISERSLWFDEAFSWRMTQFSPLEIVGRVALDNSPPLYYLLLKAWVATFGDAHIAMRSLSVLFGGATIIGMYLFAVEAFSTKCKGRSSPADARYSQEIGLLIAALTALSIYQIRWAWEVRMYTLGTALFGILQLGNVSRVIPHGYIKTLATGQNCIADRDLAKYHDKLKLITGGEIFDPSRLMEILRMNLVKSSYLIDEQYYRNLERNHFEGPLGDHNKDLRDNYCAPPPPSSQ